LPLKLPDYALEMAKTTDGSPAVRFRLRGEAEALALSMKLQAEQDRRSQFDADRRRASEVDALMDKLANKR